MISKIKTAIRLGPVGIFKRIFNKRAKKRYLYFGNLTDAEYKKQQASSLDAKVSIVVPCYNTPKKYLQELISSIVANSHKNFELILADASESDIVSNVVFQYDDDRIIYKKLLSNEGISKNTNSALQFVTGDVIVFCDHDDILMPDSLYEVAKGYLSGADFIFSDMDRIDSEYTRRFDPYFKGDFGPDTLRSSNYICHLFAISKELYQKVGDLDSDFDGSQDYDYILRCSEQASKPLKIDKILYCWRVHENSVAADISAKPYAITAAENALLKHIERQGIKASLSKPLTEGSYKFTLPTDFNISVIGLSDNEDFKKFTGENDEQLLLVSQKGVIIDKQSVLELAMLFNYKSTRYAVPMIVRSDDTIVCSGFTASNNTLYPLFQGYQSSHNGYANRNLTINNISAFSPLCYMMRASDRVLQTVAESYEEVTKSGYAVFNPYARAVCDVDVSSEQHTCNDRFLNENLTVEDYDIRVKEGIV